MKNLSAEVLVLAAILADADRKAAEHKQFEREYKDASDYIKRIEKDMRADDIKFEIESAMMSIEHEIRCAEMRREYEENSRRMHEEFEAECKRSNDEFEARWKEMDKEFEARTKKMREEFFGFGKDPFSFFN